jgi:hypothetical protein
VNVFGPPDFIPYKKREADSLMSCGFPLLRNKKILPDYGHRILLLIKSS